MDSHVLGFHEIDRSRLSVVGGKGAGLGELSRVDGVRVPDGFVVTTHAFRRIVAEAPALDIELDALRRLAPGDHAAIGERSAEIRRIIEAIAIPDDLAEPITRELDRFGEHDAYAVRSSATAEDLPTASFAGQQDSYLNVVGRAAVLRAVSRCWGSLFTQRAVTYRLRNGFDDRMIGMAVVVQRMLFPEAAGVLFTADPVTGNRTVSAVEATFGLGEALVSGRVDADVYRVRGDEIVSRTIGTKALAVYAAPAGGIEERAIAPEHRAEPVLTDERLLRLTRLGRRIERQFGGPQDIEWCLVDGDFQIVQSRPVTTLFPVPRRDDEENHVYISVGHQQMMTDPMKPLGYSMWQLTAFAPMFEAGSRLFVDVTSALGSPAGRAGLMAMIGKSDPLIGDALQTLIDRGDFIPVLPDAPVPAPSAEGAPPPIETDAAVVSRLIERSETSLARLAHDIRTKSGPGLFDFLLEAFQEHKRVLGDPGSHRAIMAGMEAAWWLNEWLERWLGEKNAADTLAQSVPGNVTSEMGLALLDVADAVRPHPAVVAFLQQVEGEDVLRLLSGVAGGPAARAAIERFLDRYGVRCVGEIDITRPRWRERPLALVPAILANVRNFAPGEARRRFERGQRAAARAERELLERLRALPDGEAKAAETKRAIDRLRTFAGYREYPKFAIVSRYAVYKQALMDEAERLVRAGVLEAREDIFYLTFQELRDVVRTGEVSRRLLDERAVQFRWHQALTPPRVLTSEGEAVSGAYRRGDLPTDLPPGALAGLAVSAGRVEGRARVVLSIEAADLEPGDILVTAFTDPSWTPLFVSIAGLVTEVGGLMTHGAVIAREYGIPAVVGVEHATRRIRDGQRIRVHGTDGYVEILPAEDGAGGTTEASEWLERP